MLDHSLVLEQRQTMSANQIQSLEILTYTNQELENFLTTEYLENPILENSQDKQNDMIKGLEQIYEKGTSYRDHYIKWEDEDCNRRNDIHAADEDEMKDFLLNQLSENDYSPKEWTLMEYLIQCLDEEGFFTYSPSELAEALKFPEELVGHALDTLKTLEPIGIFSSDISECLLRQMEYQGIEDKKLFLIVEKYLPEILEGRIGAVSRSLNLSTTQVKEYIHYIGTLNPRPIMSVQANKPQYIVPDILITLEKDIWHVTLNDSWMGEYKYNEYYIRMMQESKDEELIQYFRERLERARFLISCVEQRRNTIITIVENILEMQDGFFKRGEALRPMTMDDIAKKSNIHVSTVSRAIKDKYLQYKRTIYLKDLFTTAALQGDVSSDSVKEKLKQLIRAEDSKKPLSDLKIAELMQKDGIVISRRTVTKYRKQMGIPESRQRLYL